MEVRRDEVRAFLDGKLVYAHKTDFADLGMGYRMMTDEAALGLGSYSPMIIYGIEVTELSGPGTFTRPDDPAAQKAAESRKVVASEWRSLLTAPGSPPPGWRNHSPKDAKFETVAEKGDLILRTSGKGALFPEVSPTKNYHLRLEFRWPNDAAELLTVRYHGKEHDGFSMNLRRNDGDYCTTHSTGDYFAEPAELEGGKFVSKGLSRNLGGKQALPHSGRAQLPLGEWNVVELICLDDASIQIVNGRIVLVLMNQRRKPPNGPEEPINDGSLGVWTVGASEVRQIKVRDITGLPPDVLEKAAWRPTFPVQEGEMKATSVAPGKTASFTWQKRDGEPVLRASTTSAGLVPVGATTRNWKNFHLRLEYRYPTPQSARVGVIFFHSKTEYLQYFVHKNGTAALSTYPNGNAWADAAEIRDGKVTPSPNGPSFDLRAPIRLAKAPPPTGEWNVLELICLGDTAIQRLNGKIVGVFANCRQKQPDGTFSPRDGGQLAIDVDGELELRRLEVRDISALPSEILVPGPWEPLFNGKDLTGWRPADPKGTGKVEVVVEDGKPTLRLTAPIELRTLDSFADYHLRFEYKAEKDAGGWVHFFNDGYSFFQSGLYGLNRSPKDFWILFSNMTCEEAELRGGRIAGVGKLLNKEKTLDKAHLVPLSEGILATDPVWHRVEVIRLDDSFLCLLNGKIAGMVTNVRGIRKGEEKSLGHSPFVFGTLRRNANGPAKFRNIEVRVINAVPPEILAKVAW